MCTRRTNAGGTGTYPDRLAYLIDEKQLTKDFKEVPRRMGAGGARAGSSGGKCFHIVEASFRLAALAGAWEFKSGRENLRPTKL